MSAETNKAVARGYIEQIWNAHRMDLFEQYISKDLVHHDAPGITDYASVQGFITVFLNSFPDIKVKIEAEIAEGDLVVIREAVSGTQQAEFMGIPASGKQFSMAGISIFRIADGKIAELWSVNDTFSMMQQLGVIPAPASG